MRVMKDILLAATILLVPFQDSGLQATPLGFLGASPSFIPLCGLLVVSMLSWLLKWRESRVDKSLLLLLCYVFSVNAFYFITGPMVSHGTNLLVKTVNLSVLTLLLLFPAFYVRYDSRLVPPAIKVAFFITLAGIVLGDILRLDAVAANPLLHYHENLNMRPRGLTLESSWLSALIITLGLLSAHYSKDTVARVVFVLLTVTAVIFSASKGGVACLFFAGMVYALHVLRRRPQMIALFLPTYFAIGFLAYRLLLTKFTMDISSYASTATRSGLALTSVVAVAHNPFGVGFSGMLPAIDRYVPVVADLLQTALRTSLNLGSLLSFVGASTDIDISTKTFLLDFFLFYGWPFLVMYAVFHVKLIRRLWRSDLSLLLMAVAYVSIAISTYIGAIGLYNIPLVYGVALDEIRRQENAHSGT